MEHWKGNHVVIVSERLLLTPLTKGDAEEVLNWINNGEIVKNFQFFTGTFSFEDEVRYIEKMTSSPSDLLLGVITEDGELIGTCGLHEIDFKNDTARLGIIIGRQDHWNMGYAQEAIRAVLKWAFSVMGLHKIYLNVFATNRKAFHLYGEVGFLEEGAPRAEYKIRGQYVDMLRMAILKEEWNNGKAS